MHLNPAEYIIYKFKGVRPASRALNIDSSSISKWQVKGLVPSNHQRPIIEAARERGILITPKDIIFGKEVSVTRVLKVMPWLDSRRYYPHDFY